MTSLYQQPEVVAFLLNSKEHPQDNTPRLVLADWLDDHGDPFRAEFIRLQCRLASASEEPLNAEQLQAGKDRVEELLDRFGGAWAGPLWSWRRMEYAWRRGLLAVRLARPSNEVGNLGDVLPWIDSLHIEVGGRGMLGKAPELLNASVCNQVGFCFMRWFPESTRLDCLARVRESHSLRTLTFWCVRPAGRHPAGAPASKSAFQPSQEFLSRVVRELPLGRHLTRLGIGPKVTAEEASFIRGLGVEPFDAQGLGWME